MDIIQEMVNMHKFYGINIPEKITIDEIDFNFNKCEALRRKKNILHVFLKNEKETYSTSLIDFLYLPEMKSEKERIEKEIEELISAEKNWKINENINNNYELILEYDGNTKISLIKDYRDKDKNYPIHIHIVGGSTEKANKEVKTTEELIKFLLNNSIDIEKLNKGK
jgi:hypothetical protein